MNKVKKIVSIILINFIFILMVIIINDFIIYRYHAEKRYRENSKDFAVPPFKYQIKPEFYFDINTYFTGGDNIFNGRKPEGIEYYKDGNAIVIFGCSFAHGQFLNDEQTFSYKLAHFLKRPVYNRAIPGRGVEQMYLQTQSDAFYKDVPKANTVIYVMIDDHYRRMNTTTAGILDIHFTDNYKVENGKIVEINYKNPIKNIIKSSYLAKVINQKAAGNYVNNPKNEDKITDEMLLYFTESKKALEYKWNNKIKFIVLLYTPIPYENTLVRKLKNNGFEVYSIKKEIIPDINLLDKEYLISENNIHPNEKAWNEIVKNLVKKVEL